MYGHCTGHNVPHDLGHFPQYSAQKNLSKMKTGLLLTPEPRPIELKDSPLGKVPNEIIENIASHLPKIESATFRLSCTQILGILGDKHLKAIGPYSYPASLWHYDDLLSLLENDSPDLVMCWECRKLHSIGKAQPRLGLLNTKRWFWSLDPGRQHYWQKSVLPCWSTSSDVVVHENFNPALAQMAMKLYRQGKSYQQLLRCLDYRTEIQSLDTRSGVSLNLAGAKIVGDSLLFRKQTILLCPITEIRITAFDTPWQPCHCDKMKDQDYTFADTFMPTNYILQFKFWSQNNGTPCNEMQRRNCCMSCKMETQIDFQELGAGTTAIFLTAWQELSKGKANLAVIGSVQMT
ncbi:uncharacterized protein PAC_00910 [Phialocephala subalpina]|uniref:F-box domain-containing protein n=1 Tax=Phialocephala subalpina TaxID=576137 RepID=A0A1L7WE23_9HELO|nr:uncharacterized protein PAC_00910 [Phialocephala subalpina]